jgi:Outer membrane lipoprotein-sorting protein
MRAATGLRRTARRQLNWILFAAPSLLSCVAPLAAAQSVQRPSPPNAPTISAEEILRHADAVRFPQEGFEVAVNIRTSVDGKLTSEGVYKVLSKGNENTLVLTLEPASERGQILLMKQRDLWVFLPRVSQPVRLSLAQRLVGQISNGDLARANFVGDYTPKLIAMQTVDNNLLYVLELTAVARSVTYQRVRYWVQQGNYRPYKAEFYSLSGRLLKTCRYEQFRRLGGVIRPTKLVMTDAINQGEVSTLEYSDMKLRELQDRIFTKDYLKRLQ